MLRRLLVKFMTYTYINYLFIREFKISVSAVIAIGEQNW